MIKGINHIAIIVRDLDEGIKLYGDLFGLKPAKVEIIAEQGVKAAAFHLPQGSEIELIMPIKPDTGVAKFLETKGEGIHHLCLEVDDVDKELSGLDGKGVALIDKKHRIGLAGKIGFIHPKATKGTLIELGQRLEH